MKKHIYVFYNRKVEAYENPVFRLEDENEMLEAVTRDYKASDDLARSKMDDYNLIHLGVYDDLKGAIILQEPNFLLNLATLQPKKEETSNA